MLLPEELEGIPFLEELLPDYRTRIARAAQLLEYPTDAVVFREGQEASFIYLVLEGLLALDVQVAGRGDVPIQTVGAGELLGWSPVLGTGPMTATARCLTRCRLAALSIPRLHQLCDEDPRFGQEFLRRTGATVAQRLNSLRRQMASSGRAEPTVAPADST